jgi:Domain of unknown function (DUF3472)
MFRFRLRCLSPALLPFALVLPLSAARGDEKLAGIACRSVHLAYPAAAGTVYLNEVTVDSSAPGTYFCVCGFDRGYYGIQELGNGKKVAIFSVWDPGKQDDPKSVADAKRVRLLFKDPAVRVGRFGGEGTGGQSFLDLDWKPGQTYRLLVTARPDGEAGRTAYSAFIATPEAPAWRKLVTFSTLSRKSTLGGYYAFIEDFRRNRVSATQPRSARYGPGWVFEEESGRWHPLNRARFTADGNPSLAIDAGSEESRFFLATGGSTTNTHAKLGKEMSLATPIGGDRPPGELPPLP